ncbi:MAG TPA: permease prefix domain 1-containing protein [Candidatus Binatia bacterium]|nr:permease prefix domain 1-containing protein [Candidatus Binatia bacterium]
MFDLEQAIGDWRQALVSSGVKAREVLDELESHLRDEVDRQVRAESVPEQAFEAAVRQLGETDLLKSEFAKNRGLLAQDQLKQMILTLAGIPTSAPITTMNTSPSTPEPGWATYLKGAAFTMPALFLWTLAAIFIVPKFQQIARDTNFPTLGPTGLWNLSHVTIQLTLFVSEHFLLIATAVIGLLILLEWRSAKWPRYRRATVGTGAFLLNSLVLISIFVMLLAVMVMAPAMAHRMQ